MPSIILPVTLDQQQLKNSLTSLEQNISKNADVLASTSSKFSDTLKKGVSEFGSGVSSALSVAGKAAGVIGVAIAAATAATYALSKAFDQVQQSVDILGRAKIFGVLPEQVAIIRKGLSDVKSDLEATALATTLVQNGFKTFEIKNFVDAVSTISAISGQTKQAVEDMLKSGSLTEEVLKSLGKSQQELDVVLLRASNAAGGRDLSALEKTKAILKDLSPEIDKVSGKLGDVGRENPFAVLLKDLQSIWEKVVQNLKPAIEALVSTIKENKQELVNFFESLANSAIKATTALTPLVSSFNSLTDHIKRAYTAITGTDKKFTQTLEEQRKKQIEDTEKAWAKVRDEEKKAKETAVALETKKQADLSDLRNKASNARRAQAQKEALEEQKGRMAEARAMIRNFDMLSMEAAASTGGPVSGALSAFKDSFEKFKVLASVYANTIKFFGTKSDEELQKLKQIGKITESQIKAIKLYRTFLEAGEVDLRDYINNEKIVNTQLAAQGELLAGQQKIAASGVELINHDKNVRGAILPIQKVLNTLQNVDNVVADRKRKILEDTLKQYQQVSKIRQNILKTSLEQAKLEASFELNQRLTAFDRASQSSLQATQQLGLQLLGLQGKETALETQRLAANQARLNLGNQIFDNEQKIALLRDKMKSGQSETNLLLMNTEVKSLEATNNQLSKQLDLHKQIFLQQKQNLTVGGAAMLQLMQMASDASQKIGQTIANSVQSFASSIGNSISGLFEGLAKSDKDAGANFGKTLLSALGDIATAFASTFMGIGIGKVALGDVGGGAALIAASVALYAVAGGLKGLASGQASGTSQTTTPSRAELPGTVTRQPEKAEPTFILVSNRIFGSEEDQARALKQFVQRGERITGRIF